MWDSDYPCRIITFISDLYIVSSRLTRFLIMGDKELDLGKFFDLTLDMLCIASMEGYFLKINPSFEKILGYSENELTTRPFVDFIHPEDVDNTINEVGKLSNGIETVYFENRYRAKNGKYHWLAWTASPLVEKGLLYSVARDITEKKELELRLTEFNKELEIEVQNRVQQIENSNQLLSSKNEENKILLSELHHRVKNNVQMINSTTHLYSRKTTDVRLKSVAADFSARTAAISLVYDQLSLTSDFKMFDMEQYIGDLFVDLKNCYGIEQIVELDLDIDRVNLSSNTIVPLGLILSEILSNSFKYAFSEGSSCSIFIHIKKGDKDGQLTMLIGDDGVGIRREIFDREDKTFGMEMLEIFTQQLDGSIKLVESSGTVYELSFVDQLVGSVTT